MIYFTLTIILYVYLLVIDYFYQWIKLALVNHETKSDDVILHLKSMFAKFGISNKFISNGGPQFSLFTF